MKKNYMILSGLVVLVVVMIGIYMWMSSGPAESEGSAGSENLAGSQNAEDAWNEPKKLSKEEKMTDEQIRTEKGTHEKGGMNWTLTDPDLFQKSYAEMKGLDDLSVFEITNLVDDDFREKLADGLKLEKNDPDLGSSDPESFFYDNFEGNKKVSGETVEKLIDDLHIGVWEGSVNYGTIHPYGSNSYELTYEFNGYPWVNSYYGSSYPGSPGSYMIRGFDPDLSMAWRLNAHGNLTFLSGFAVEVEEKEAANQFASPEELEKFVSEAMNKYADDNNAHGEITEDVHPSFIEYDVTGLELWYTREIPYPGEKSGKFVPVLVLKGDYYSYDVVGDYWNPAPIEFAVSLETGALYDWRKD